MKVYTRVKKKRRKKVQFIESEESEESETGHEEIKPRLMTRSEFLRNKLRSQLN